MKTKDEIFEKFQEFKALVENQIIEKINRKTISWGFFDGACQGAKNLCGIGGGYLHK
jgi:hypothetical protein